VEGRHPRSVFAAKSASLKLTVYKGGEIVNCLIGLSVRTHYRGPGNALSVASTRSYAMPEAILGSSLRAQGLDARRATAVGRAFCQGRRLGLLVGDSALKSGGAS
jgi:hypothetical protein